MPFQLTREIWSRFADHAIERAHYFESTILRLSGLDKLTGTALLDIGGGSGINAATIGEFSERYSLDIHLPERRQEKVCYIEGDAHRLPFENARFDFVSLFSVIEHVEQPEVVLREAVRVLKPGGLLVVQFPNHRFPLDLHTGLPNPFYFPKTIRNTALKLLGYGSWSNNVYRITPAQVVESVSSTCSLLGKTPVIYPVSLVPNALRIPYELLAGCGLLKLIPMSYLYLFAIN